METAKKTFEENTVKKDSNEKTASRRYQMVDKKECTATGGERRTNNDE